MNFLTILLFFIIFRSTDFLIAFLAPIFIPYLGFFPYKEVAAQFNLPAFINGLANFDGAHYLLIARDGYQTYQQAFFPLYPLLIRWLSPLFADNLLLTGILISNISFLIGLIFFTKYLKLVSADFNRFQPFLIVFYLIIFPTSFFFGSVYTEGLFFLCLAGSLYFLKKENYILSGIFALFASLTKLIGVFLIIFYILKLIENLKFKNKKYGLIFALVSPPAGLIIYMIYLWRTTGDPLFFLNSQWAFGAQRSSSLIFLPQVVYRYLNIFFTARFNFQYFISLFEFFSFALVFTVLILDLLKNLLPVKGEKTGNITYSLIGLNLFSLANLLLPTLTGTFSSIPRYALFSLSFFIYLSRIKSVPVKIFLSTTLTILHVIILGFFIQGYFVS